MLPWLPLNICIGISTTWEIVVQLRVGSLLRTQVSIAQNHKSAEEGSAQRYVVIGSLLEKIAVAHECRLGDNSSVWDRVLFSGCSEVPQDREAGETRGTHEHVDVFRKGRKSIVSAAGEVQNRCNYHAYNFLPINMVSDSA